MLQRSQIRGSTLIELLVVSGIIGLLVALLLPAVQGARGAARRSICQSHLRQDNLALLQFEGAHNHLPAGGRLIGTYQFQRGFAEELLPFLEETTPIKCFASDSPLPATWLCPNDPLAGMVANFSPTSDELYSSVAGSYLGVAGKSMALCGEPLEGDGVLFTEKTVRLREIVDGLSKTLAIGERAVLLDRESQKPLWGTPLCGVGVCSQYLATQLGLEPPVDSSDYYSQAIGRFWTWHSGITHFSYVGGRVEAISTDVDQIVLDAASTRANGE
jgi:type II secretory pathway pseudopilin PulG